MESRSPKLNYRSFLLMSKMACLLFSIFQILQHNYRKKYDTVIYERSEDIQEINIFDRITLPENQTQKCTGNLLDQRRIYLFGKDLLGSLKSSKRDKRRSCRLLHYTTELAVSCLDAYHGSRNQLSPNLKIEKTIHIVFMGDSRMRQQFYNFLRLIPDHDRKSNPSPIPAIYHEDIEVTSEILRLRVSFKWRPFVDDNVTETMRLWATSDQNRQPNLILFSMVLWHIVHIHSLKDYHLYYNKLTDLIPILNQLSNFSEIIWLNQYPTSEFYGGMPYGGEKNSDVIVSGKLHYYNEAIRHIFQNCSSSVQIWDSSNPVAEEYVRACTFIKRGHSGPTPFKDPDHSYIECYDYIHTGYSALSQATQLLYNNICNNLLPINM